MEDLKPVDLYFTTEIWQHTDQSLGWRLKSNLETLDIDQVSAAIREVAQQISTEVEKSTVTMSIMIHENGRVFIDTENDRVFSQYTNWMLTRTNLHICLDHAASGRTRSISRLRKFLWSIEWFVLHMSGHFEARQKAQMARQGVAPPPPAKSLAEPSKALNNLSEQGLSNVVTLRPKAPL